MSKETSAAPKKGIAIAQAYFAHPVSLAQNIYRSLAMTVDGVTMHLSGSILSIERGTAVILVPVTNVTQMTEAEQ